jgi:hypothetical protein
LALSFGKRFLLFLEQQMGLPFHTHTVGEVANALAGYSKDRSLIFAAPNYQKLAVADKLIYAPFWWLWFLMSICQAQCDLLLDDQQGVYWEKSKNRFIIKSMEEKTYKKFIDLPKFYCWDDHTQWFPN